jgi:excisionase family DNA binding protein
MTAEFRSQESGVRRESVSGAPGDQIDDAIGELIVAERKMSELLSSARHALTEVEEENRRLKREAARTHLNWYTEKQLAARMGVSKDTLARLRRNGKIPHVRVTPTVIRYSSLQEVEIAEMLQQSVTSGQLSVVRRREG